jgi:hypothetical protein
MANVRVLASHARSATTVGRRWIHPRISSTIRNRSTSRNGRPTRRHWRRHAKRCGRLLELTAVKVLARLFVRGEWGFEAQILHDGVLFYGQRFDTRGQAEHWAEAERKAIEESAANE